MEVDVAGSWKPTKREIWTGGAGHYVWRWRHIVEPSGRRWWANVEAQMDG